MILIISSLLAAIGILLMAYGFGKDDGEYVWTGFCIIALTFLFGFGLLGFFVDVDKRTSFPTIDKLVNNDKGVYFWFGDKGIVTSDAEVIRNPKDYIIRKTEKLNSYGYSSGAPVQYYIEKK